MLVPVVEWSDVKKPPLELTLARPTGPSPPDLVYPDPAAGQLHIVPPAITRTVKNGKIVFLYSTRYSFDGHKSVRASMDNHKYLKNEPSIHLAEVQTGGWQVVPYLLYKAIDEERHQFWDPVDQYWHLFNGTLLPEAHYSESLHTWPMNDQYDPKDFAIWYPSSPKVSRLEILADVSVRASVYEEERPAEIAQARAALKAARQARDRTYFSGQGTKNNNNTDTEPKYKPEQVVEIIASWTNVLDED